MLLIYILKSGGETTYDKGLIVQSHPGAIPRLKRYLDEEEDQPKN
jgi:hypothetical protein